MLSFISAGDSPEKVRRGAGAAVFAVGNVLGSPLKAEVAGIPPKKRWPPVAAADDGAAESPADITLAASDDMIALNAVEALATSERAARNFTDTSSFALQCRVCGAGLKGNADAEAHAAATGHQNFAQTGH